jgi:hypothetical protein
MQGNTTHATLGVTGFLHPRTLDKMTSNRKFDLLAHIAPLGWEHIIFNGNYIWPEAPLKGGFRPLRNPQANFLEAA